MRRFSKLCAVLALFLCLSLFGLVPAQAANTAYQAAYVAGLNGAIDFDSATGGYFKVALVSSSYTPNPDHTSFSTAAQPYECSGSGYTAGGTNLVSPTVTADTANNREVWDAADTSWAAITISGVRYVIVYRAASAPNDTIISCKDLSTDKSASGGELLVSWASTGISYIAMP